MLTFHCNCSYSVFGGPSSSGGGSSGGGGILKVQLANVANQSNYFEADYGMFAKESNDESEM